MPKTEGQRWIEKLHNFYSGGAVVPLPFLRAFDAAPLTLLGIEDGAAGGSGPEGSRRPGWETALRELVQEAAGPGGGSSGGADELPPAVVHQVQGSPVLLNLASALATCKRQQQQAEPVPVRVREQLQLKCSELSDSLRTILCL